MKHSAFLFWALLKGMFLFFYRNTEEIDRIWEEDLKPNKMYVYLTVGF